MNLFYGNIICGNCGHTYSGTKYKARDGHEIRKWRCGSCNMTHGHKVCSNRYVTEESFVKLFIMSWNEIVTNRQDYEFGWKNIIEVRHVAI